MEAIFPFFFMVLYGIGILICAVALIYFIVQRIEKKGNEGFEERDW